MNSSRIAKYSVINHISSYIGGRCDLYGLQSSNQIVNEAHVILTHTEANIKKKIFVGLPVSTEMDYRWTHGLLGFRNVKYNELSLPKIRVVEWRLSGVL